MIFGRIWGGGVGGRTEGLTATPYGIYGTAT